MEEAEITRISQTIHEIAELTVALVVQAEGDARKIDPKLWRMLCRMVSRATKDMVE